MSWVDKAHRKNKIHNLVEQAMMDKRFIDAQKKQTDEAVRSAFDCFLLISVDYLHRYHKYSKKRIIRFIEFANKQMQYIPDDNDYFKLLNDALAEETGVNILNNKVN